MPISQHIDDAKTVHFTAICNRCLRVGPTTLNMDNAVENGGFYCAPEDASIIRCRRNDRARSCTVRHAMVVTEPGSPCPHCGYHLDRAAVLNDQAPYVAYEACPRCEYVEPAVQAAVQAADSSPEGWVKKMCLEDEVRQEVVELRQLLLGSRWRGPGNDGDVVVADIRAERHGPRSWIIMVEVMFINTRSSTLIPIENLEEHFTRVLDRSADDESSDQVLYPAETDQVGPPSRFLGSSLQSLYQDLPGTVWVRIADDRRGTITQVSSTARDDVGHLVVEITFDLPSETLTVPLEDLEREWVLPDDEGMVEAGYYEGEVMVEADEPDEDPHLMTYPREDMEGRIRASWPYEYAYGHRQGPLQLDWGRGPTQHILLTGNVELSMINRPSGSRELLLRVEQDWRGNHAIDFGSRMALTTPESGLCHPSPGSSTLFRLICVGEDRFFLGANLRYTAHQLNVPEVQAGIWRLRSDPSHHVFISPAIGPGGRYHSRIEGFGRRCPNSTVVQFFDPTTADELRGPWTNAESERVVVEDITGGDITFGTDLLMPISVMRFLHEYRKVRSPDGPTST